MYKPLILYFQSKRHGRLIDIYIIFNLVFLYIFFILAIFFVIIYYFIGFEYGSYAYNLGNSIALIYRPLSDSDMAFTETDAVSFIIPVTIISLFLNEKLLLKIILAIFMIAFSVLFEKSIMVLCVMYLAILSFLPSKYFSKIFFATNILCWFSPIILITTTGLWQDNFYLNSIANGRFLIWETALNDVLFTKDGFNIENFLFGGADVYVNFFNYTISEFTPVSYHSAFLRLLLTNGLIAYIFIWMILAVAWFKFTEKTTPNNSKVVYAYLGANLIFCVTDSSIAYSFDYYFQFLYHLLFINFYFNKNSKNNN
jgi:hypothetical protein